MTSEQYGFELERVVSAWRTHLGNSAHRIGIQMAATRVSGHILGVVAILMKMASRLRLERIRPHTEAVQN